MAGGDEKRFEGACDESMKWPRIVDMRAVSKAHLEGTTGVREALCPAVCCSQQCLATGTGRKPIEQWERFAQPVRSQDQWASRIPVATKQLLLKCLDHHLSCNKGHDHIY